MKRVIKLEGRGNIAIEEVEIPSIARNQVLVKSKNSLISRGSELFARYVMPGVVDPAGWDILMPAWLLRRVRMQGMSLWEIAWRL